MTKPRISRPFQERFKRHNLHWNSSGFTLTEILIVCAIVGILAAVAIPSILAMIPHWRLKSEARELFSSMQATRLEAIKRNQVWGIVFDGANSRYSVCSSGGADNDWSTMPDNVISQVKILKENLSFGVGNATLPVVNPPPVPFPPPNGIDYPMQVLLFNPQGTISASGFTYLQNQNNATYAVGTQTSGVITIRHWGGVWD